MTTTGAEPVRVKLTEVAAGDVYSAPYPFKPETYTEWDVDGAASRETWAPGVRFEDIGPEDVGSFADALGKIELTVVSVHKPGRFPARVFYTRQWVDPAGSKFGKSNCRVTTEQAFRRLASGYRHPFALAQEVQDGR